MARTETGIVIVTATVTVAIGIGIAIVTADEDAVLTISRRENVIVKDTPRKEDATIGPGLGLSLSLSLDLGPGLLRIARMIAERRRKHQTLPLRADNC